MYRAGGCDPSQLVRDGRLSVVEGFAVEAPKITKLSQKLKGMGLDLLVITDTLDENLYLSSRNLPNVLVLEVKAKPIRFPWFASTCSSRRLQSPRWRRCGNERI